MAVSKWTWRALALAGMLSLAALLAGFGWALRVSWFPPEEALLSGPAASPSSPAALPAGGAWDTQPELFVAALGDSLTKGTGDGRGEGYVAGALRELTDKLGKPVKLINNLAVNGYRTEQLLAELDGSGYRNAVARAHAVLFTIGGNDLFRLAHEEQAPDGEGGGIVTDTGEISPGLAASRLEGAKERLGHIFAKIREINPNCRIVYVGLYNPFYDLPEMKPASGIVAQWNEAAYALAVADGNATVVPVHDLFEFQVGAYLAADHFHPNAAGYERIAARVVQALS